MALLLLSCFLAKKHFKGKAPFLNLFFNLSHTTHDNNSIEGFTSVLIQWNM